MVTTATDLDSTLLVDVLFLSFLLSQTRGVAVARFGQYSWVCGQIGQKKSPRTRSHSRFSPHESGQLSLAPAVVLETTGPLWVFINGRPFDVRRCFVRRATATTREDPGVADSATRWPGPGGSSQWQRRGWRQAVVSTGRWPYGHDSR